MQLWCFIGASVWRAAGVASQAVEVAGARSCNGYADPEYFSTGRIKPASDVYGLGVVMLEVLTAQLPVVSVWDEAKKSVVPMSLVSFALPSIQAGRLGDVLVLDRRPAAQPTTCQQLQPLQLVANMVAQCLCLHGDNRPAISDVVARQPRAGTPPHMKTCMHGHFELYTTVNLLGIQLCMWSICSNCVRVLDVHLFSRLSFSKLSTDRLYIFSEKNSTIAGTSLVFSKT
jgi:serine/threonine protein kinase